LAHSSENYAQVPMQTVGPIKMRGAELEAEVTVPLATDEHPLGGSVNRGARVTLHAGGIHCVVISDKMTRSVAIEAANAQEAHFLTSQILSRQSEIATVTKQSSRFAELQAIHSQIVGKLIYLRFEFSTGDASGHNMATLAADYILNWLLQQYPQLTYVSISGNYCTDKKNSAVNGILGRGKYVVAETTISPQLCRRFLKTTPEKIVELNFKKNYIGSILAGGVRTANAHFANMLLAFYLATGQDAANIVEGSQGMVYAEVQGSDLYFSVTVPNLIVGSVGNGKELPFVQDNLKKLGCLDSHQAPGNNARRLAAIAAATVLCGELSLLSALTNPHELMQSHVKLERKEQHHA